MLSSCEFQETLIQGLQEIVAHQINSMQLLSSVKCMQAKKNSSLTPKRQSLQVHVRAIFVALILKFQSLISAERTSKFLPKIILRSLKELELTKFT